MASIQFAGLNGQFTAGIFDPSGNPQEVLDIDLTFTASGTIRLPNFLTGVGAVTVYADELGGPIDKAIGNQNVNLTGQFLCSRAAVREFKRRGVRKDISCAAGKIICISSVHEVIPWAGHVNYAASKGGVMLMMKSIAQEVAPHRIRVNSIAPGATRTSINMSAWDTPAAYAELMKLIPYKRIGEPSEIGRVAAWLASDYADYITGQSIFVDGGMTLYPGFETGG